MDKKNTAIGIALLIAAGVCFYLSAKYAPQPAPRPAVTAADSGNPLPKNEAPAAGPAHMVGDTTLSAPHKSNAPVEFFTLGNDTIEVRFTNAGGAIDSIALKKHRAVLERPEPYTINSPQAAPALGLVDFPGLDKDSRYTLVSQTANEVVYRVVLDDRLEVTRRYTLLGGAGGDPYQIRNETTFHNLTNQLLPLPRTAINIGTISPLNENDSGIYLLAGSYDGNSDDYTRRDQLAGGGFFTQSPPVPFIERTAAVQWATVKNQFFATILTPDQPGTGLRVERVKVDPLLDDSNRRAFGLTANALFDLKPLPPGASTTWAGTLYAGPKEYRRLANTDHFKHSEDRIMQFSSGFGKIFLAGFFAPLLLTIMGWVHSWLPFWGWAVVVMTLLLKFATLPFTLAASRSSKHMQKIMPLVQEVREKYKDNPAKQQEAMMRVYKENKVNPLGGCIPVLITMPFFIGYFSVLQSDSDLRFASFLWVKDLAAPDTVISFATVNLPLLGLTHLSLNILPLLMGATMIYTTRITPNPNMDPTQAAMMKFMPLMYMLFCYNFAAALALYSTINGLFTIVQQKIVNSLPEPQLPGEKAGAIKNVTPKKK